MNAMQPLPLLSASGVTAVLLLSGRDGRGPDRHDYGPDAVARRHRRRHVRRGHRQPGSSTAPPTVTDRPAARPSRSNVTVHGQQPPDVRHAAAPARRHLHDHRHARSRPSAPGRVHLRRPHPERHASERAQAGLQLQRPVHGVRVALRARRRRHQRPDRHLRANRSTGALRRVSIASSGAQALGGESTSPAISADGRFIAFQSRATNLVPGDTNGVMDVFVHDRDADGNGVFDEAGQGLHRARRHRAVGDRRRRRPGAGGRRRQRRSRDQRQRPLRGLRVGRDQPAQPARRQQQGRRLRVRSPAARHAPRQRQHQRPAGGRPQPQPGDEPERPLHRFRVARQRHRRRRIRGPDPDHRHLPARSRHRRKRRLSTSPATSATFLVSNNPCEAEPHQPQHRAVDHLRRTLRGVRHRRRQRQGRWQLPGSRLQRRPRHLHLGPAARVGGAPVERRPARQRRAAGRQRRAGDQRQRQPAAVPHPGHQRRRRSVGARHRRRGRQRRQVDDRRRPGSPTGNNPPPAPTCRPRPTPAAPRIRRRAATATPPATPPSPIPAPAAASPSSRSTRDAGGRRRHARRSPACRPRSGPTAGGNARRDPGRELRQRPGLGPLEQRHHHAGQRQSGLRQQRPCCGCRRRPRPRRRAGAGARVRQRRVEQRSRIQLRHRPDRAADH